MESFHQNIFKTPLKIHLLKIGESMNIIPQEVPLKNILSDKWVDWHITLQIYTFIYLFWAETAFDIFGTNNAEEFLTCGFQYPSLPISILHFVAKIFGHKWYNFDLLNSGESGKHQNLQAIFTLVNITYNFSKVRVGLPGVCSSKAMI